MHTCTPLSQPHTNVAELTILVHVSWVGPRWLGLGVWVYLTGTELPRVILAPLSFLHLCLVSEVQRKLKAGVMVQRREMGVRTWWQ